MQQIDFDAIHTAGTIVEAIGENTVALWQIDFNAG